MVGFRDPGPLPGRTAPASGPGLMKDRPFHHEIQSSPRKKITVTRTNTYSCSFRIVFQVPSIVPVPRIGERQAGSKKREPPPDFASQVRTREHIPPFLSLILSCPGSSVNKNPYELRPQAMSTTTRRRWGSRFHNRCRDLVGEENGPKNNAAAAACCCLVWFPPRPRERGEGEGPPPSSQHHHRVCFPRINCRFVQPSSSSQISLLIVPPLPLP